MAIGSESGLVNLLSPKFIKLQTSSGASITIDESGIKLVCSGTIKIRAVKKSLLKDGFAKHGILDYQDPYDERFVIRVQDGDPVPEFRYRVVLEVS